MTSPALPPSPSAPHDGGAPAPSRQPRGRRVLRLLVPALGLTLAAGVLTQQGTRAPAPDAVAPVAAKRAAVVTPGNFTGYGFDQCLAPTQRSMNKWRKHSPFSAVGIYISGDSRACRNQPNLSSTWVSTQHAKGWKILPIALGPQASCQPRFPRYKDDFRINPTPGSKGRYGKAKKQGRVEAAKNAADAAHYGIGTGSTLWYDLEGFDLGNTHCRESALAFVSAWVKKIESLGYVSGVYSSAGSGMKMLDDARVNRAGRYHLPRHLWIADWDGKANTKSAYIRNDGWRPGGRMKQYRGGHNETWGGVTINIDSNWLDLGLGSVATRQTFCNGTVVDRTEYLPLVVKTPLTDQVKTLQCLLRGAAGYSGKLSGKLNKKTRAAMGTFQQSNGFTASTTWSRSHWTALLARGSRPVLKRGSAGADVFRLQRALNTRPGTDLAVTGVYNKKTEKAVTKLKKRLGNPAGPAMLPRDWKQLQRGRV